MKYIIVKIYGSSVVDVEDLEAAVSEAYNNHTGYDDVLAIVKVPEDD